MIYYPRSMLMCSSYHTLSAYLLLFVSLMGGDLFHCAAAGAFTVFSFLFCHSFYLLLSA